MIMNTNELTGAKLDYWVAKAEGLSPQLHIEGKYPNGRTVFHDYVDAGTGAIYAPSSKWGQGGPIIEREKITINPKWFAGNWDETVWMPGDTILQAAMRCFVASKFGKEVQE
jgi:hypothetical protein